MNPEWLSELKDEFEKTYMENLSQFVRKERQSGKSIYPSPQGVFKALRPTPPQEVKVVVVGQDPYHNPGQAHGLSFSVPEGVMAPPSLQNIFKELKSDVGVNPTGTNLTPWANQGVLLLNSMLTVEKNKPGSHQKKGWEEFTDKVLQIVDKKSKHCVFILWGSYAQRKGDFIDSNKHLVLKSPHPSPLSAHRGFFGSKPFSQANSYLEKKNLEPVRW